ncbi:MAG: bifunctional precorrin-2 dehydrogenase/sirohydrochlorin ferrochelatase [Magnetococcales bacterium]|nr:bifunctional precorrin-2 dehydrogenase/sirohydrochlorin ferrochelatase [Magnetococcales bacterium]
MSALLPLFLDLTDKPCLVIGADEEARNKTAALLQAGALPRLLIPPREETWEAPEGARRLEWPFHPDHLEGCWLVLCAWGDSVFHEFLSAECRKRNIFLNVVDRPKFCSVQWPAVVQVAPVTVAISTRGASPALASYLKKRLGAALPEELPALAAWMSLKRSEVAQRIPDPSRRSRFWKVLLEGGVPDVWLNRGSAAAEELLNEYLERELEYSRQPNQTF